MKPLHYFLLGALLLPSITYSQKSNTEFSLPVFGLGMKITPFNWSDIFIAAENGFNLSGADVISVPININPHLRIEPEAGFSITTYTGGSTTGFDIGTFVGPMWQKGNMNFYAGPRILFTTFSVNGDNLTGILIGGALGGEYFFSNHFSAGAEFHLSDFYLKVSDDDKTNTISTDAAFTTRIYFK